MSADLTTRHAGLDPASSAVRATVVAPRWTPDQVRGDEVAISFEGSVG